MKLNSLTTQNLNDFVEKNQENKDIILNIYNILFIDLTGLTTSNNSTELNYRSVV